MSVVTHSGETEESKTAEVAADALDPLVGQTIDGRFRVVEVIGKGAMGKVYRAVQLPLNRAVALKVLDSTYGAGRDESFRQRFLVEAALTAKLNHPNTVRVVDYGSTKDGLFFFAMEYLDGETLEQALTTGALPWHRVLHIGQQIARALREAHELGVVHRDLKPANVVMLHADDDTDFVKVLDFGLVKSFIEGHELEGRAITQQGMLMGSPPYMAPEQGEKNRADPRSDIYSLGTMLFEMLTGKPPYTGSGALEVILKHVNDPIPPLVTPARYEPPPDELKAIVVKCLAKSPMDRFQSMEELLLALQDVAPPARAPLPEVVATEAAVPVVAEATTTAEQHTTASMVQPARTSLPLLAVGFALAVVAGVGLTWSLMRSTQAPGAFSFHVDSQPPGATVLIDGQAMGTTPLDLEQGLVEGRAALELRFEKAGFTPIATRLGSTSGKVDLVFTLQPLAAPVAPVAPTPPAPPTAAPVTPVEPVKAASPTDKPAPKPEVKALPRATGKKQPTKADAAKATSGSTRLDEEDEPVKLPSKNELKRPTPND